MMNPSRPSGAVIRMSATPKSFGFSSIFGSSAKTPSANQQAMSKFSTMKPQVPSSSSRASIKMLSSQSFLPPMPGSNARPDFNINRASTVMYAEPSKEVDTFKDREFVIGETFE